MLRIKEKKAEDVSVVCYQIEMKFGLHVNLITNFSLKSCVCDADRCSGLSYLEMVDRTGDNSQHWQMFKEAMKFVELAGSVLNTGLHRMTGMYPVSSSLIILHCRIELSWFKMLLCSVWVVCFVCWLLNVPATCLCISGTDLHRQFYVLPH